MKKQNFYHGTGNLQSILTDGFKPELTGKGNDQFGSGFYFTNNLNTVKGYTESRIEAGIEKLGGEESPGVIEVSLDIKNPLIIQYEEDVHNLNSVDIELSPEDILKIIKTSPATKRSMDDENMNPLGDHFEEFWVEGSQDWMFEEISKSYSSLINIENDFFSEYPSEFREALFLVTGYDGVIYEFSGIDEIHAVAWFPEQITYIAHEFNEDETLSASP